MQRCRDAPRARPPLPYTAWHYLLIQALESLVDPALLKIMPFHKLGTLPIEADLLLMLKEKDGPELAALLPDFDFMLRYLRRVTVVEYKGPTDTLRLEHMDTALAYVHLAKRKHGVARHRELCLQLLYSSKVKEFLAVCADNGLPFVEIEPGIRRRERLPFPVYLMDLVELSDRRPDDLINLLSARHRRFIMSSQATERRAAVVQRVYYTVLKELMRMLMHERTKNLPGAGELIEDMKEIRRRFLASLTPEERLEGLPVETWLEQLPVEKRLEGLSAEDRLKGLSEDELARLHELLGKKPL